MGKQHWTSEQMGDQTGRVAIVTGSNSGIGREAAAMLARKGAAVVMAVRDPARGEEAAAGIRADMNRVMETDYPLPPRDLEVIGAH